MNSYKLKDLLSIKNGKDHKELKNGEIPVYGSGGIMRFGDKAIYNDESILLPRKGTLSNIQYVNKPFWTVDTIYYSVINKKLANPFYLFNFLKCLDLTKLNSGTGVPSMTFNSYYDLNIKLPDLPTQQKIASVLFSLDAKIELNQKINRELEAMAKTIYDYWFVQFDFPDPQTGRPYKSSGGKMVYHPELKREIPEGWEVGKLEDITFKIGDGMHGTPMYVNQSQYFFINGNNLRNGFIEYSESTKKVSFDEFQKYHIELNNNTILLSINGTLGNVAIYSGEKIMLGKSTAYINCKSKYRPYCYYFLKSNHTQEILWNIATGSTIKNLSLNSLKKMQLICPPDYIIEVFYSLLSPIDEKKRNIFFETQTLTSLRDWLLPMLMNGQVRVGD